MTTRYDQPIYADPARYYEQGDGMFKGPEKDQILITAEAMGEGPTLFEKNDPGTAMPFYMSQDAFVDRGVSDLRDSVMRRHFDYEQELNLTDVSQREFQGSQVTFVPEDYFTPQDPQPKVLFSDEDVKGGAKMQVDSLLLKAKQDPYFWAQWKLLKRADREATLKRKMQRLNDLANFDRGRQINMTEQEAKKRAEKRRRVAGGRDYDREVRQRAILGEIKEGILGVRGEVREGARSVQQSIENAADQAGVSRDDMKKGLDKLATNVATQSERMDQYLLDLEDNLNQLDRDVSELAAENLAFQDEVREGGQQVLQGQQSIVSHLDEKHVDQKQRTSEEEDQDAKEYMEKYDESIRQKVREEEMIKRLEQQIAADEKQRKTQQEAEQKVQEAEQKVEREQKQRKLQRQVQAEAPRPSIEKKLPADYKASPSISKNQSTTANSYLSKLYNLEQKIFANPDITRKLTALRNATLDDISGQAVKIVRKLAESKELPRNEEKDIITELQRVESVKKSQKVDIMVEQFRKIMSKATPLAAGRGSAPRPGTRRTPEVPPQLPAIPESQANYFDVNPGILGNPGRQRHVVTAREKKKK